MRRKERSTGEAIHRVDLSIPIVQNDACEIIHTKFSPSKVRQNTLVKNDRSKKLARPLDITLTNMIVDINSIATSSNRLHRIHKSLPRLSKRHKQNQLKDHDDRSRSSSGDRLLFESFGSFDDENQNRGKQNSMWQNIHHPQLISTKTLHTRGISKCFFGTNDTQSRASFDHLSQESTVSTTDQLYERTEQLTKTFFPTIQQIRHSHLNPTLVNNRIHLHRVHERTAMLVVPRAHIK